MYKLLYRVIVLTVCIEWLYWQAVVFKKKTVRKKHLYVSLLNSDFQKISQNILPYYLLIFFKNFPLLNVIRKNKTTNLRK